jgi:hypothetical protein
MAPGETLGQAIADESRGALGAYASEGARQMLQRALEYEVVVFLAQHADRANQQGREHVAAERIPTAPLSRRTRSRLCLTNCHYWRFVKDSPNGCPWHE